MKLTLKKNSAYLP